MPWGQAAIFLLICAAVVLAVCWIDRALDRAGVFEDWNG